MVKFDWDPAKAKANIKMHKVSFEEASTVFSGEPLRVFLDSEHSSGQEDWLIAIGIVKRSFVSFQPARPREQNVNSLRKDKI